MIKNSVINENYGISNMYNKSAIIGWYRSGASSSEISWLSGLELNTIERIITNHLNY